MDISTQAQIVLRDAKYETWTWPAPSGPVTCFESAAVMGFVYVFESAEALVTGWHDRMIATLTPYNAAFQAAGRKSWGVYSVFLTAQRAPSLARDLARIEEDIEHTRKIARTSVLTAEDVESLLLPLVGIRSQPKLVAADFKERLRARWKDLPADAATSFLNGTPAADVVRILVAKS
ncbi:hypothetical protein [Sinorhizobium medicae]|uniref:hypothetical protein n=1 Tax=Sinorhizobium medicae TaxID=110321 RepID=UPI00036709DB|nr:hypothetical protein [Sinorhizobium medicae]